jgi:hypothetical protein
MSDSWYVSVSDGVAYPGEGYYYVICDVCGGKFRKRDTTKIRDKYNTLNNMIVCKKDIEKTNPQQRVKGKKDTIMSTPEYVRKPGTDRTVFISSPDEIETGDISNHSGVVSSAPTNLQILNATSSYVDMLWQAPITAGTNQITGYKIERASPAGGSYSTIVSDTQSEAMYYQDTSVSASTQYQYRVSAVNVDGISAASDSITTTTSA